MKLEQEVVTYVAVFAQSIRFAQSRVRFYVCNYSRANLRYLTMPHKLLLLKVPLTQGSEIQKIYCSLVVTAIAQVVENNQVHRQSVARFALISKPTSNDVETVG